MTGGLDHDPDRFAGADDVGVPWLPAAPVDVAEYLTALIAGGWDRHGAAVGVRSVPLVTSGSQKTDCANRTLNVWTFGEETPSTALGGPVRNIPVGRRGSMSMAPTYWATGAA